MEFRLPELGEGIEGGTVVSVAVKSGDKVRKGQELFTLETDKASVPIPSPADGAVTELRVKEGAKVNVGAVVAIIAAGVGEPPKGEADSAARASRDKPKQPEKSPERQPDERKIEQPRPTPAGPAKVQAKPPEPQPQEAAEGNGKPSTAVVPAGPATRRLARELGVNLQEISGSARGGRVTLDDVKSFARERMAKPAASSGAGGVIIPPLPDFSRYGPVEARPLSNLRKKIAENLAIAWNVAPAVTQFDQADITELEAGRKRIVESLPKGAPRITMTILAIKACVAALREIPHFNASLDARAGTLIVKQYYHVGIAVDTERGLVVPVVRDADKKSVRDLAKEVTELADKARNSKLSIEEMRGGTFTITNLGGIGGTAFSPIINYPEVAILGMARSSLQPVIREGKVEPRLMLPLCLTYDHRVIDGADGARFTTRLVQMFSDPIRLLMET